MEKQNNLNELNMDYTTYTKVKGKMNPQDRKSVTITGDKPTTSSTSMSTTMEENEVIQPQDKATIKYLSNVKDANTGEVSKPFTIGDKKYQMIRGVHPTGEVGLAVFCHDDMDDNGENLIHAMEYFEENIAKPMKEQMGMVGQDIQVVPKVKESGFDYADAEREYHDKEAFMDYLNLSDIEPIYRHFFVNIKNGNVVAKFKNTKDMVKSGIKLGPDEDYMDIKTLKRFRFGDYFKGDVNEVDDTAQDDGTNIPKLQADVKKLGTLIKNKFSVYLSKLDKPIEQAQFLTAMANEIGVPLNKLSTIISSYKDIAAQDKEMTTEKKVITKGQLEESLKPKKTIKVVKVKDIK
jgi:CRISPR/Cas system CMR-associated protein Cmr5 small subunit